MKKLDDSPELQQFRTEMIQFLNEFGLNGMAILAMARIADGYSYAPGEEIVRENEHSRHIYFLMSGSAQIRVEGDRRGSSAGTREAVTMLGEIAYFNDTPATATATVAGKAPAVVFRLGYDDFSEILERFPDARGTLARIGEMRMIRHLHGFIAYRRFMDMIGWPKDRFAVNRAFAKDLDDTVNLVFKPLLKKNSRILEVGDGPGLVSEMLHGSTPDLLDRLFLQATHLESAIADPLVAQPSDFTRAQDLDEKFDAIIALQVFNIVSRHAVEGQFDIARGLLNKGGFLLAAKSQLLDITHDFGASGNLIFNALEELVESTWPGAIGAKNLIETSFLDADLDPIMEWNKAFCGAVTAGELSVPQGTNEEDRVMLELLLEQAARQIFDPEDLHYRWLEWKAHERGFKVLRCEKHEESAFFFHLLQKP